MKVESLMTSVMNQ